MKKQLIFVFAALVSTTAMAQTFGPGAGYVIPDNSLTPGSSSIVVSDAGTITSLDFVEIDFGTAGHTWAGDLIVALKNTTTGDDVHLFSRLGSTTATGVGDSSNLTGVYRFTATGASFATAAGTVTSAVSVPNGTYARSSHGLGAPSLSGNGAQQFDADDFTVFTGDAIAGTWVLSINDNAALDTGSIAGWNFGATVSTVPEPASMAALGLGVAALLRRRKKS